MRGLVLLVAGLLVGICLYAQKNPGFTIKGELIGLKDGTMLYLWHVRDKRIFDTIGRSVAKGGRFRFAGQIPVEGALYHISIDTARMRYEDTIKGPIDLLLENKDVTLKGSVSNLTLHHIMTKGLEGQDYYKEFKLFDDSLVSIKNALVLKASETTGDSAAMARSYQQQDSIHSTFVSGVRAWARAREHQNSIMSPWVLIITFRDSVDYLREAYAKMSKRIQNGKYGRDLKDLIDVGTATKVGSLAPDFSLIDIKGENISLSEEAAKGKVTILVFWASWCSPCRAEVPELKRIYAEYHEKGLNVLGYSVDESDSLWLNAIRADSLPWNNVREKSEVASTLYGVRSIPMIFILDNNRKVVEKGIQAEDLEKTISDLLEN